MDAINTKLFNNNKGLTLIELIATISLIGIVIAISSTLIIQLVQTDAKTSEQISLSQETNILINELKNQFEKDSFDLIYTSDKKLDFRMRTSNSLLVVESIEINNEPSIANNIDEKRKLSALQSGGDAVEIDNLNPLTIKITTKNKDSKSFTLETTWDNYQDHSFVVYLESEVDEEDQDFDDIKKREWVTVSILPCGTEKVITDKNNDKHQMPVNIKWDGKKMKTCKINHISEKSLWITDDFKLENGENIRIKEHFYTKEDIELENGSILEIWGKAYFGDDVKLKRSSQMTIAGGAKFKDDIEIIENSRLTISGDSYFDDMKVTTSSHVIVAGNVKFKDDVKITDNSSMIISGNAIFDDVAAENSSYITVTGNMNSKQIKIKDNSHITINGSATYKDDVKITNNSSMKINGSAQFADDLDVLDNSCLSVTGEVTSKDKIKIESIKKCK